MKKQKSNQELKKTGKQKDFMTFCFSDQDASVLIRATAEIARPLSLRL
jgi:hypothetical protein